MGDSPTASSSLSHSNVYVRNLDPALLEPDLAELFAPFGGVESCRIAKYPQTQASKGFGFVKLSSIAEAQDAIASLNGTRMGSAVLEVKSAESDTSQKPSGQLPGDNLYVRGVPSDWTTREIYDTFSSYGTVVDCRLLSNSVIHSRGALVRMSTVEEATNAMQGENARLPLGAPAKLQVRYADSLEEKKAKRATASARSFLQPEARLHEHLPAGFMSFPSPGEVHPMRDPMNPMGDAMQQSYALGGAFPAIPHPRIRPNIPSASVYIKNLPPSCDKLLLYEHFAPQGAILSVKVLTDSGTGLCRGVGFVNYATPMAAMSAVHALHGLQLGEKPLHVSLQTAAQSGRTYGAQ